MTLPSPFKSPFCENRARTALVSTSPIVRFSFRVASRLRPNRNPVSISRALSRSAVSGLIRTSLLEDSPVLMIVRVARSGFIGRSPSPHEKVTGAASSRLVFRVVPVTPCQALNAFSTLLTKFVGAPPSVVTRYANGAAMLAPASTRRIGVKRFICRPPAPRVASRNFPSSLQPFCPRA